MSQEKTQLNNPKSSSFSFSWSLGMKTLKSILLSSLLIIGSLLVVPNAAFAQEDFFSSSGNSCLRKSAPIEVINANGDSVTANANLYYSGAKQYLAVFWNEGNHVPAYTLECDDFNAGVPLYTMRADLGATDATHRWEDAAGVFFNGETGTVICVDDSDAVCQNRARWSYRLAD